MFAEFRDHPGLYFVAATLLPLLSFVVLLLAGGVRWLLRPGRGDGEGEGIYQLLSSATASRTVAYIATGAIGFAFLLSLVGGVTFFRDEARTIEAVRAAGAHGEHGHDHGATDHKHHHENEEPSPAAEFAGRWTGSVVWADLGKDERADSPPVVRPASRLTLGYRIDSLTVIMFLMVTFISTLIHIYSIGYMADELEPTVEDHQVHTEHGHLHRRGRFGRFFLFLSLFCFSMLNLVLADNLFQVFLSWELVGICSYLLIGFYYERQSASNAANKAFITNRVGDAGFILGVLILWTSIGTLNFEELFRQVRSPFKDSHGDGVPLAGQIIRADFMATPEGKGEMIVTAPGTGSSVILYPLEMPDHYHGLEVGDTVNVDPEWQARHPRAEKFNTMPYWLLVAAGLGIFLGCVGKSAQFPLHVWLPDAMEGPTPVSALIHAATMVAAGVYLVARVFPLFTPESRLVIAYTGAITLFVAATIAVVMTDIKKVLAYSTVSQLGYMMLALGVGGWMAGVFHLLTHAFFKALLFLGSGSVIHGCHHEQEMTKMGGLYPKMKITALTMLVGVLTIAGTPFFSGWYSKDAILAQALGFARVHREHILLFLLPLVTAGITTFYMFRMWFLTFTGTPRDRHVHEHAHESPWLMTMPLVVLAFFSVCVAWGWPFWDAEASVLGQKLHHGQPHHVLADFGALLGEGEPDEHFHWEGGPVKGVNESERLWAFRHHTLAEVLALLAAGLGVVFALLLYYYRVLDPAESKEQFPALYRFLSNKWYFDEVYSVLLVRPALAVAGWCQSFDLRVLDGLVDALGRWTVRLAKGSGWIDLGIVDGLVNLTANVIYAVGSRLRAVQTGYLRSYVLFLVLAAVAIFAILSYFVTLTIAG